MRLMESEVLSDYLKTPEKDRVFDFYRCYKCGNLFNRREELKWFAGAKCACGSQKYSPSWPRRFDWVRPSVIAYTLKVILARNLAPLVDRAPRLRWLLKYIERMVR